MWDVEAQARHFLHLTENSLGQVCELRAKARVDTTFQPACDEEFAKFYVFSYLQSRKIQESRASLLRELKRMLDGTVSPRSQAYDAGRLEHCREKYVRQLLAQYSAKAAMKGSKGENTRPVP